MKSQVLLLLSLLSLVAAHSYVECADWRFNNPARPGWTANDGTCHGYPRRWPKGAHPNYLFGHYDNVWFAWIQRPNDQPTACSPTSSGSDFGIQTRTANIANSYAPGNPNYGAMTVTKPGQQICFTWSARNHASGGETCYDRTAAGVTCPLDINFATQPGVDPTQAQLNGMRVGPRLTFQNCTAGSAFRPDENSCGGCFIVPQRNPGIYTVQWRWGLNGATGSNNNEVYTSCIDMMVLAADSNTRPSVAATSRPSIATSATTATSRASSNAATSRASSNAATSRASSNAATSRASSNAATSRAISSSATLSSDTTRTRPSVPAAPDTAPRDESQFGTAASTVNNVAGGASAVEFGLTIFVAIIDLLLVA